MTQPTAPPTQQVSLQTLTAFCQAMASALRDGGVSEDRLAATFAQGVAGECAQCGLRVGGDELYNATAVDAAPATLSPKTARLRQGYCARHECSSYYYRLEFRPVAGVDWTRLLERVAGAGPDGSAVLPADAGSPNRRRWTLRGIRRTALQILLGAVLLTALLFVRRWYNGGTIPLVREPRPFTVDPASLTPQRTP